MKVKVNRVRGGSMGDQRNYGLITGSIWNYEDKPSSNQVGTTMSPVPRDEATIEAERGETIVGDLDNDGMLEHAIVGGKRHFAGGTPLNVPDGSFVFSDTRALKINNKDVLKGIFNMGGTGITPAKVAKRYDLNQYKDLLMDPESDLLTKKTAQMMIDNNMKKLGQLALIQEGMKGFPDGIPNIALPLFANDIAQPESSEGTPMMKRGGLVKAQGGKQVKKMTPEQNAAMTRLVQKKAARKASTQWSTATLGTPEERVALKRISKLMQDGWSFPNINEYYNSNPTAIKKSNIIFDPNNPKKGLTVLDKDLPVGTPAQNQAMHNLVLRKAQQKAMQKMTTPDKTGTYGKSQAVGVDVANKLYTEALLSGDPKKMREASSKIDEINILGKSTPLGTISEGLRGIAGFGATFLGDILGFAPNEGYDFSSTEPYGATWQEKINDMRDILDRKANQIDVGNRVKSKQQSDITARKDYGDKLKKINERITAVLANPNQYPVEEVQKALDINEKINDPRFLGIPSPSRWGLTNPYEREMNVSQGMVTPELSINVNEAYEKLFPQAASTLKKPATAVSKSKVASSTAGAPDTTTTITNFDPTTNQVVNEPAQQTSTSTTQSTQPKNTSLTDEQIRQMLAESQNLPVDSITQENIDAYRNPYATGGTLPKHQSKGPVLYDVKDRSVIEGARKKGKRATYPYPWYNPNLSSIGPQTTASGDYTVLPSGVISRKNATSPIDIQQMIASRPQGSIDWTTYPGGKDKFIKDMEAAQGKASPASTWWVEEVINPYSVQHTDYPAIDVTKEGAFVPGYEWATTPIFEQIPTKVVPAAGGQDKEPVATTQTTELGKIPSPTYTGGYTAPWSNYSMVDNAAALANYFNISRGDLPIKQRFTPYMPDETFMNPARAIAQQQGLTRASQEAIMSGADPTTGRANVIAAQAAAAPQTADIMSKYDQANVGIANQMESARAQILNEAELRNLGLDKQYMDEIATLNQQYQNALAAGRTEVAESVKRAMVDAMQRGALNVQNPNYAIGPNGQIYFKPGFNPATGTNIFAGTSGLGNIPALMKSYMTDYQLTGDQAAALIRAQLASRGRNSYGVSNPMDALWNSEV